MGLELNTATDVIDALGGNPAVAELTNRTPKAVSNWRAFNAFPPDTFLVLTTALAARDRSAPASLWRMVETERAPSGSPVVAG